MDKIKDVLHSIFHDMEKRQHAVDFQKTAAVWEKTVGPKAAGHTKIVYLTKDKIRVNVDNSAWLYTLNLEKARIQKELKKTLKIEDVKLRLGAI